MARSEGFEPSTAWFVARYSIQLSYERADPKGIREVYHVIIYLKQKIGTRPINGGEGGIRTLDAATNRILP